jgi:hypothetical protein
VLVEHRALATKTHGDSTSSFTIVGATAGVVASKTGPSARAIENAVYGHIRAIRALGRTQVSASEIAAALSIPVGDVITALNALRSKGSAAKNSVRWQMWEQNGLMWSHTVSTFSQKSHLLVAIGIDTQSFAMTFTSIFRLKI